MPTIEEIQSLIKLSEQARIENWRKDYYKRIADNLQVHTKGQLFSKIATLFPNENPASTAHCINTYEPITKSSIWKGINNIIRIFNNSSFTVNVSDASREWLNGFTYEGNNLFGFFLEQWVTKCIGEDPNGLIVVYPIDYAIERGISPIQFVRSDFIKAREKDFITFTSELDSTIEYNTVSQTTHREIFYDPKIDGLNGITEVKSTYNLKVEPKVVRRVYHTFTKLGFLKYEEAGNGQYNFEYHGFPNEMSFIPVFSGGGQEIENDVFDSFVGPFVPFGNLCLLQHRNHRAVDLMFSYPRMSEIQTPCDHCTAGYNPCPPSEKYPDGKMPCGYCKSSGYVTVTSPYKVIQRKYDPEDQGQNKHLQTPAVEFYSPDVGILSYSKDAWRDYLKMAESAIFVQQKVMTGQVQSAESKGIDLEELYAWLYNISKVFYDRLRLVLQAIEEYINPSPLLVSVEIPYSFAILTEAEAFEALNTIINSEAPVFVKANEVENFVNKFVSKGSPVVRALQILKKVDLLLFYSNKDAQTFKSNNVINPDLWTRHVLAYPVLVRMYESDKQLFEKEDEAIITALEAELDKLMPKQQEVNLRDQLLKQMQGAQQSSTQTGEIEEEEEEEIPQGGPNQS